MTIESGTRPRGENNRRQQLLDAAATLVLDKGIESLTLDAVSETARVSKGGLLYYFDSKQTLLESLLDSLTEQLRQQVERQANGGSLAKAYLEVVVRMGEQPKRQQTLKALTLICAARPELAARLPEKLAFLTATSCQELQLRLLADGIWMADLFNGCLMTSEQRSDLLKSLDV